MKKEIYLFSGLGADERVFHKLNFSDFSTTFVQWIPPSDTDSIEDYTTKLLAQITTANPILIGVSFGGLIAIEVAKQIKTEKVIIIASAKTKNEIPIYYRLFGQLGLHKLLPAKLLKSSNFMTNWFFGVNSKADKQLLKHILFDTSTIFLKWAIDKVLRWRNQQHLKNLVHIHGTKDRILPFHCVQCDIKVPHGGHLMTLNQAETLNAIIQQQLKKS